MMASVHTRRRTGRPALAKDGPSACRRPKREKRDKQAGSQKGRGLSPTSHVVGLFIFFLKT